MRTHLVIALVVLLGLTSFSTISQSALYKLVPLPGATWDEARTHMQTNSPGYWLATITSGAENTTITNLLSPGTYWIGGFQNPSNEQNAGDGWTWVNNEGLFYDNDAPVSGAYNNWKPGEPNDNYTDGSEQHLILRDDGLWNDEGGPNIAKVDGYIAEIPIPGAVWMLASGLIGLVFLRRRTKG
jgi:hypothetical protein